MNERIKKLRKFLGLTQQEFGDRIGIKRNTLANYEIGRNEPIDAVLNLICREFNVNETWLRTGEGEMFRQDEETIIDRLCAELHADELESAIIQAYFRIDEKIRLPFLRRPIQEVQKHPIQQEELEELETAADAFAAMAKEQFLSEKRRESRASSVKESDAG